MRRVVRVRSVQPDLSPGMVISAILLVIFYNLDWLNPWTLAVCVIIPPLLNLLLVGRTTRKEIHIDDDPLP